MPVLASTLLLLAVQAPVPATDPSTTPAAPTTTETTSALQQLGALEAELSVGRTLRPVDVERLIAATKHPAPEVRATAAAVLPWLEPGVAVPPLLAAVGDADPRVRATAAQSLVPLARRLDDDERVRVADAATLLLDDANDEVACAAAELVSLAAPDRSPAAFVARTDGVSDVRYACWSRFGGLPARAVTLPALNDAPDAPPAPPVDTSAPAIVEPTTPGTQWLFVADAAAAGLLIGGGIPSAVVPARDLLVYDDDRTRSSRQDVAFVTSVGSALVGGLALGGGAYLLDSVAGPLDSHEALAVVGATGSGALLGAGAAYALDPTGGGGTALVVAGTAVGLVGGTALAYTTTVSPADPALVAGAIAMAGVVGGLGTFAALPVALTELNGVPRRDVGLGAAIAAAGLGGLVAVGVAPVVEVTPARVAAVTAGGLLGAGLVGGIGLLAVPADLDVGSRVAAGLGAGGAVLGLLVGGLLVPGDWLDGDGITAAETTTTTTATTQEQE